MTESPSLLLALDQGTTSSRAILFNQKGRIVASAQKEFPQRYPKPGWVEHDPADLWSSQSAVMAEVMSRADVTAKDLAAVGVTNQRETTLVWDRHSGKPVCHALVWQDRRTADLCTRMKEEGLEPDITQKTGLRLDPYFSGTKLKWILDHVDGARQRAERGELLFGTVDTWLIWQLTGRKAHVTDATNASRTLLYNLHTGSWDPELLNLFTIPDTMLPRIVPSSGIVGTVADHLQAEGVPIAGVAGDQHAALFGQTCFDPGMAKSTYGTGSFLLMNMGSTPIPSRNNLLSTVAWQIGNKTEYALEGSVFIAGAAVQWLRDELQIVRSAKELDRLAAEVQDAGGMYLVPAFAGLGAPHWDPYARGVAVGLTRGTNRAHFCRAALESIAFQTADLITCMEKDSGVPLKELRVDGGVCHSEPMLQFQADLLQSDVVRPACVETTALGVAYLAGLAVGFWSGRDEVRSLWQRDRTVHPIRSAAEVAGLRQQWDRAVERAKGWEE